MASAYTFLRAQVCKCVPLVDIDEKEPSRLFHRFDHNTEFGGHGRVG